MSFIIRDNQEPTDHDLATLADWAEALEQVVANPDWKSAYAHLRKGADLLLRRRARSKVVENEEK